MGIEIVVTRYRASNSAFGLKLALVSDLHNCDHSELLALLHSEQPDAILCAGDILERHEEGASEWTGKKMEQWVNSIGKRSLTDRIMWLLDRITERNGKQSSETDTAIEFLKRLPALAPTFYSVGNHEWYFLPSDYNIFEQYGINLLDNNDCEIVLSGQQIRIGGLSTRYDLKWLKRFSNKNGYKILLCHHPEYYRKLIRDTDLDTFNLVLSGHYHGGQWRIKGRSVYVPRTGLFVKDAVGQFGKHIISAGVANTTRFPRYGNPCELVMIEI